MDCDQPREQLLRLLDIHGQRFLTNFLDLEKRNSTDNFSDRSSRIDSDPSEDLEEWLGIDTTLESNDNNMDSEISEDFDHTDDDFVACTDARFPTEVIFANQSPTLEPSLLRAHKKAFMSSKVSKLRETSEIPNTEGSEIDAEDEKSNAENDAILHRLIHTKLLSGSLNPELNMTPAQRRRALSGRVLEIAGAAKLGKGERSAQIEERNKAAKRVREGIKKKQIQRSKAQLEEAKNLGNYHPSIKRLFQTDEKSGSSKKRQRGLKMSVGKFSRGTLRLSGEEIRSVQGGTYDHDKKTRHGKKKRK